MLLTDLTIDKNEYRADEAGTNYYRYVIHLLLVFVAESINFL